MPGAACCQYLSCAGWWGPVPAAPAMHGCPYNCEQSDCCPVGALPPDPCLRPRTPRTCRVTHSSCCRCATLPPVKLTSCYTTHPRQSLQFLWRARHPPGQHTHHAVCVMHQLPVLPPFFTAAALLRPSSLPHHRAHVAQSPGACCITRNGFGVFNE